MTQKFQLNDMSRAARVAYEAQKESFSWGFFFKGPVTGTQPWHCMEFFYDEDEGQLWILKSERKNGQTNFIWRPMEIVD